MELLGPIARGGFGRIERVRLPDGRIVARKVFDPAPELASLSSEKLRKRFAHEVEAQRRLAPYGAIAVLAADLEAPEPWFTMPLAEKSFRAQVESDRTHGTVTAEPLIAILDALEQMHRLGYVHRDLKPENVLFCEGSWRLADFGLVAVPHGDASTRLTSTATSWATMLYCAPEQALDFRNADKAADTYAFGCILHDIVGGRPRVPFQTHTAKGPLGAVISRCTQIDPRQRFKSISALRGALIDAIARSGPAEPTAEAEGWSKALERIHEWDADKLEELIVHAEERPTVCAALDEERIVELHGVHTVAWRRVALTYCCYAQGRFAFARCDEVATCLLTIFELGDVDLKAAAVMSLAVLGLRHNRWFALRKLVDVCGPALDAAVAERLALDLRAEEREDVFLGCASAVAKSAAVFHPRITSVLEESVARSGAAKKP